MEAVRKDSEEEAMRHEAEEVEYLNRKIAEAIAPLLERIEKLEAELSVSRPDRKSK